MSRVIDNFAEDASKLSAKIKNDAPGKEKEAEKKGEELAQRAGSQFDKAVGSYKVTTQPMY